jgi:hypothetical protein
LPIGPYCTGVSSALLGDVNNERSTSSMVVDSGSDVFDLNDRYVLCSRPPACVIVEYDEPTVSLALPQTNILSFLESILVPPRDLTTRQQVRVRRTQVPLTPAFATTDYKAQGATLEELEMSLAFSKLKRGSNHYKWTSLNLQLRRLPSFAGLCLREEITMDDVQLKPDDQLGTELQRLETLGASSEAGEFEEVVVPRGRRDCRPDCSWRLEPGAHKPHKALTKGYCPVGRDEAAVGSH